MIRSAILRTVTLVAVTLTLVVGTAAAAPTPARAKSFTFDRIAIEAMVNPDASLSVAETREFDFDGSFTWVQWELDTKGSKGIEVTGVQEETAFTEVKGADAAQAGTYSVRTEGSSVIVRIAIDEADSTIPLTVRYTVKGAAKRYQDTAELYWQFIGDRTEVTADRADIHVVVPNTAKDNIRAWAHGPLTGQVTINEDGSVSFVTFDLPPRTFVEARMTFPPGVLSMTPTIEKRRLEAIMTEEARLADAANAQRRAARAKILGANLTGALVPLFALLGALVLFARYGREHRSSFPRGYWREDPDPSMSPALIGELWRMGKPGDAEIGATLMDLSLRGIVRLEPAKHVDKVLFVEREKETYALSLDREKLAAATPTEQQLLRVLFDKVARSDSFTLESLKDSAKDHAEAYAKGIAEWKELVHAEARQRGFVEPTGQIAQVVTFVVAAATAGLCIWVTVFTRNPLQLLGVVVAVVIAVLGVFMSRRGPAANELYAKYRGVRDYLRDFSRLKEAPPTHVVLWERFLVMAVVFGIAEQVIEALKVKVPELVQDPAFHNAVLWTTAGMGDHGSPVSAVTSGVASAASVASSEMSSASGGGGGFSGGGGGGGGGGGVSAG